MPLPDVQIRECLVATGEFLSRHRPPPEIRDKVDYRADIKGQEVTISEVRPRYDDETRKAEHPFAKTGGWALEKFGGFSGCEAI